MARLPAYDPSVIEKAAERLYEKATATLLGSVVMGICLGGIFGAMPLTSLGAHWPIPATFGFATALGGALIGAAIGYVIGDTRAFGYRLQAQATLSQLQLERNTAVTAQALQVLAARTARRPAAPAAATAAAPVTPPAPARPVAPAPALASAPAMVRPAAGPPVSAPPSVAPPPLPQPAALEG